MQFRGRELIGILRQQAEAVTLCDRAGAPFEVVEAGAFVTSLSKPERDCGGLVGIGSRRRIRHIRAINSNVWGCGWRGGSHTTRPVRADATCRVYAAGQRMGNLREPVPCN